jgi:hypothetical protein
VAGLHEYNFIAYEELLVVILRQIKAKLVLKARAATAAYTDAKEVVLVHL